MRINSVGKSYNRLTCLSQRRDSQGVTWLRCKCVCGVVKEYRSANLRSGMTRSCGCLRRENKGRFHYKHGMSSSGVYRYWYLIKQRCLVKTHPDYKNYGAEGIKVCDRWLKFENFYEDMGDKPEGFFLNLKKTSNIYQKSSCFWSETPETPRNGPRRRKWWVIDGRKFDSLMKASDYLNVPHSTIVSWCQGYVSRIKSGVKKYPPKEGCYSQLK